VRCSVASRVATPRVDMTSHFRQIGSNNRSYNVGFFGNFKRNLKLQHAFRFGKEFYGVDLERVCSGMRPTIWPQIERYGDPIPQVVFFMIVPPFLGVLDEFKRAELLDGLMQMVAKGVVPHDVYHNFLAEYHRIDPDDPNQWAREALGGP
jgi:hypothetical protein